jgi:hypothetical protein
MRIEMKQGIKEAKKESSLPMLIGILSLMGLGYVLGMPAVASHLPTTLERPFLKFHEETNKAVGQSLRTIGL